MVENRIAELKVIFGNAHVLDETQLATDRVGVGVLVTVHDSSYDDEFEIRLVSSVEADPANDLISIESPIGTALLGHAPGEDVVFEAPEGKKRYKVISIRK